MSDLENLGFHHTNCGTNYWEKLRSRGVTRTGTGTLPGNGLASVPGRGKAIWVWEEVTRHIWLVFLLGKYHVGKPGDENIEPSHVAFPAGCSIFLPAKTVAAAETLPQVLAWAKSVLARFLVWCDCQILLLFKFVCYIPGSEFALFIWCSVEVHLLCNAVITETPLRTVLCLSSHYQLVGTIIYS